MALRSLRALPAWQAAIQIPQARHISEYYCPERCGHNAVCIREELLIWGGYNEPIQHGSLYCENNVLYCFNLDLDSWIRLKPSGVVPQCRSGACSALIWPHWYIFCGHTSQGDVNDIHRLDLVNLIWETVRVKGQNISPRDKASCWVYGKRIYCFGGFGVTPYEYLWNDEEDNFSLEFWNERGWNDQVLYFDTDQCQWVKVLCKGLKPKSRAAHSTVCIDDVVYLFGGRHQRYRLNDLHCLKLDTHTWSGRISCKGELPEGRSWHTMTRLSKTELILYGGFNNDNRPLEDVWLLNVSSFSWTVLKRRTGHPRLWHTASVNVQGDIMVFGGCISNILNETNRMVTSDKVVLLRTQPFTLERLCLHTLARHKDLTSSQWDILPKPFQEWLHQKTSVPYQFQPPYSSHNVESGVGPQPSQLAVLNELEAYQRNEGRDSDPFY